MDGESTFFLGASATGAQALLSSSWGALILGFLGEGPPACSAPAALRLPPADWLPSLISPDTGVLSEEMPMSRRHLTLVAALRLGRAWRGFLGASPGSSLPGQSASTVISRPMSCRALPV